MLQFLTGMFREQYYLFVCMNYNVYSCSHHEYSSYVKERVINYINYYYYIIVICTLDMSLKMFQLIEGMIPE